MGVGFWGFWLTALVFVAIVAGLALVAVAVGCWLFGWPRMMWLSLWGAGACAFYLLTYKVHGQIFPGAL